MPDISFAVVLPDRPTDRATAARARFCAHALLLIVVAFLAISFSATQSACADGDTRPGLLPVTPRRDILAQIEKTFDADSRRVADAVERSVALFGEPNAYIIGSELSGAFVVGERRGVGQLHFSDGSVSLVTWSALSIGVGLGADYGRVIMLVYRLDRSEDIFGTYASIGGSSHFLVGANATIFASDRARIVLISSALGLRLSGDLSGLLVLPLSPQSRGKPDTDDSLPGPPQKQLR